MANLFNNQYEDLASQGRYGDTMLAHITPEEAALLKARGGAGTINPQTGLPEFYGMGFTPRPPDPLPSLGQALNPEAAQAASQLLTKITVPEERRGMAGTVAAYEKVNPEFDQYANKEYRGMGGVHVTGYTVPTDQTFQGKPLVAKYDPKGNFQHLTMEGYDFLTPDVNQPNIIAQPKINAKGEMIDYGVYDVNQQDDGGFGSFIGGLIEDFSPMILAAIGAQFLGPGALPTTAGATGAAAVGSGALSPYAAQAAGAYGGSSAAAAAAAAGNLAGITTASGIQDALTQEALSRIGTTYGGNLTPATLDTPQISSDPSFKADYSLSQGGGEPGIRADLDPTRVYQNADLTLGPVDYGLNPVNTGGLGVQLPSMPALNSMNGGQGLTTNAFGELGEVGAKGLTPVNAVPDLGDPKSFINNPDVTGLPRLDSDVFKPTTNFQDLLKNVGEIANKFGNVGKGGTQ